MDRIEEFVRKHLKDAETTPPEEWWGELQQRASRKAAWRKWLIATAATLSASCIAFAIIMALNTSQSEAEETIQTALVSSDDMPQHAVGIADELKQSEQPLSDKSGVSGSKEEEKPAEVQPATANQPHQASSPSTQTPAVDSKEVDLEELEEEFFRQWDSIHRSPRGKKSESAISAEETESESDVKSAKAAPSINIPNLLSPNGDGYNDCWVIKDIEKYKRTEIQLYTAKGTRVFSSSNYRNDFCGGELPDGNYFYVLLIPEMNYTRRGVLVIMR